MKSTITTSIPHGYEIGDKISVEVLDKRWWPRFVCWILRREPPTIKKIFSITDKSDSAFEAE